MTDQPNLTAKRPTALRQKLFRLERSGRYREALDELNDIWPDLQSWPDLTGLDLSEGAEMKLRCGSLVGFYAHSSQQFGQQISRELIGSARIDFESLGLKERLAECDNYLALSYWRTGELREAQILLESSLSYDIPKTSDVRLHTYIVKFLASTPEETDIGNEKDARNLAMFKLVEDDFLNSKDNCLKGDYFNNCGICLDNLGRKAEAMTHFEFAKYYHERSRNRTYLAIVENNLAWAYMNAGEFSRAHHSIDNATRLLRSVKDRTREGFSLDTKATLYLGEKLYPEALATINKALAILRKSENTKYQVDTLMTKAKIHLHLSDFQSAILALVDAINIARVQTGDDSIRRLIEDFEKAVNECSDSSRESIVDEPSSSFELLLPEAIDMYTDYQGVRIKNSRLESIGLERGSLAIIGTGEVGKGDLAAVLDVESGEVVCGFFDTDFGMVCLEGCDGEPLLYDESTVRVLGKIIGVCHDENQTGGKMRVEAIKL